MPEFFFHIALEIFPEPHSSKNDSEYLPSTTLQNLKPFLHLHKSRTTKDSAPSQKTAGIVQASFPIQQAISTAPRNQLLSSDPTDHRIDRIHLACTDMEPSPGALPHEANDVDPVSKGIGTTLSGAQTKGRFVAIERDVGTEWGIVHLYRDANETPGLYKDAPELGTDLWNAGNGVQKNSSLRPNPPPKDEECTTLCILAVPSYLTPADFLAFVGEDTRDQVSHFRMIRTARANRYMVLMKFRNGKQARQWQSEWNGRVFNSMEPETCHVVFLKSVEIVPSVTNQANSDYRPVLDGSSTFPKMNNDPFGGAAHLAKPLAPRTPSLVELPTCPVCLERMDETTGLLTILCQHVFHCTCLEKWSGGGCPVCRYTHDDFSTRSGNHKHKSNIHVSEYEISDEALECETCHADTSLWQCLICGKVGCGRYEGKHAYAHFDESGHNFSMDLESKRVWDYAADVYVHRIIQDAVKPGEKLVELPGRRRDPTALDHNEDIDMAKMENMGLEYTHLLTSQLESQRVYFEDIVQRTTDKASEATKKAENASQEIKSLQNQLRSSELKYSELLQHKVPSLEADKIRLEKRSSKFEDMAKAVNSKYTEEKSLVSSLMERIKHLEETKLAAMQKRIQELEEDNATKDLLMEGLRDEHRDAMMQISAQTRLREMVARGELDEEDLEGATIEAGPAAKQNRTISSTGSREPSSTKPESSGTETRTDVLAKAVDKLNQAVKPSPNWNDEAVTKLMDDLKTKMLDEGLIEPETEDGHDSSVNKAKKKRKPRKK